MEKIFIHIMKSDLKILSDIFNQLGYDSLYISNLIQLIESEFNNTSNEKITPDFIYSTLLFELGREKSKEVSDYFDEYLTKKKFTIRKNNSD